MMVPFFVYKMRAISRMHVKGDGAQTVWITRRCQKETSDQAFRIGAIAWHDFASAMRSPVGREAARESSSSDGMTTHNRCALE
jgi:hypothetical protein